MRVKPGKGLLKGCLIGEILFSAVIAWCHGSAGQDVELLSQGATIAGAAGAIQIPSGPMLRPAPPYSEWMITYSYPEDRPAKAERSHAPPSKEFLSRPRKSTITKTEQIIRIDTVDVGGRSTEKWFVGPKQYTLPPGGSVWYVASAGDGNTGNLYYSDPLPSSGFQDMDWINEKAFAGTLKFDRMDCLVFVPGGLDEISPGDLSKQTAQLQGEPKVAYVDANTRLPVALRIVGEIRQFQFNKPPTALLSLPPDLAAEIRTGEGARRRLEQPAARPY